MSVLLYSLSGGGGTLESPDLYTYRVSSPLATFEFYDDHIAIRALGAVTSLSLREITLVKFGRTLPWWWARYVQIFRSPSANAVAFGSFNKDGMQHIADLFFEHGVRVERGGPRL